MRLWLLDPELLQALVFRPEANGQYSIRSAVSGLWRKAGPEEIIRQLFIQKLLRHYRAPQDRIVEEYFVQMGEDQDLTPLAKLCNQAAALRAHVRELEQIPMLLVPHTQDSMKPKV